MIIKGKYPIDASAQNVWNHLMDPEVLKRITPGISDLQPLDKDKYLAISKIKIGPVSGSFEGELELKDIKDETHATIVINQKSKIGNVSAEIKMQLNKLENTTEIEYKGEAKLTGKLAMMGQRIIGGVVSSLSKQFFKTLNNEINNTIR
ncbi:MAG: carbon monoxide dehydrogenase subunit G [Cyclobacteriaceae bacterium]|nr:carbon monoxide dehydrogenase subunit G [Cyclobacteriaceae bacterium]